MKCSLPLSLVIVFGLGLLFGCRESDLLVARDDDAPPQVIVITRDVGGDPRGDSQQAAKQFPPTDDLDPMRLLWIQTYVTESPTSAYGTARASFWALLDSTTGASAAFDDVALGGLELPLLDPDCVDDDHTEEYDDDHYEDLCWVVTAGSQPVNVYARDSHVEDFTGTPRFEARASERLHDVSLHPSIPPPNRMRNVRPGQQVSRSADWTIELDYAVNDPVLFIKTQVDSYETSDYATVFLEVEGEVDHIVVPHEELGRLCDHGADSVWVSLYVDPGVNPLDRFALDERNAEDSVEIGVTMASFHNVWGVQLVE